jgi:YgiT-type zinc finger domain-containing protein
VKVAGYDNESTGLTESPLRFDQSGRFVVISFGCYRINVRIPQAQQEWQYDWRTRKKNRCPLCGGRLRHGLAAVPFLLPDSVVLIKDVPAEICANCHEPFATGQATDGIIGLLSIAD